MPKLLAFVVAASIVLFVWSSWDAVLAQRPPDVNAEGVPYLPVNINPTAVPPVVNINPPGPVPRVEVTRLPDLALPRAACDNAANFETGVGQSVAGPIRLSYLNLPEQGAITFVDNANNSFRVTLDASPQLGSAIYLGAGQRLDFGTAVMYSGCRPR